MHTDVVSSIVRRAALAASVAVCLGIGMAQAAVSPVIQVNVADDALGRPLLARDAAGRVLVVWRQSVQTNDGFHSAITARLYSADGTPLGEAFPISDPSAASANDPAAAMDAAGNFVVSWVQSASGTRQLLTRRFAPGGVAQGEPIVVTELTAEGGRSAVAMDRSRGFVVAWQEVVLREVGAGRRGASTVYARRYDEEGTATSPSVTVNSSTTEPTSSGELYEPTAPALALLDADGSFIVAWHDLARQAQLGLRGVIDARRFSRTGQPLGAEFRVSPAMPGGASQPVADADSNGTIAIAWGSSHPTGDDSYSGEDLLLRRYSAKGDALGDAQPVSHELLIALPAALSMNRSGHYVTAWVGTSSSYCCVPAHLTYLRFTPNGQPDGEPVTVSDEYPQSSPAAALGDDGSVAVGWNLGGIVKLRLYSD